MSRRRVSRTGRCPYCQREYGDRRDICTNPQCRSNQTLVMRYNIQRHAVRIDTPGGTNRERPHTAMAMAFARALQREEKPMPPGEAQRNARNAADERARQALREVGNDWTKLPHQTTSDWYIALRARAIQAEDALQALKADPGYTASVERESLLDQIATLQETMEQRLQAAGVERDQLLNEISRMREQLSEYGDMPDPQETRRLREKYAREYQELQSSINTLQATVTDLQHENRDLNSQLVQARKQLVRSGDPDAYSKEQVLDLLMPLARRVHGLESKLFEQAGIFP